MIDLKNTGLWISIAAMLGFILAVVVYMFNKSASDAIISRVEKMAVKKQLDVVQKKIQSVDEDIHLKEEEVRKIDGDIKRIREKTEGVEKQIDDLDRNDIADMFKKLGY